MDGIKERLIHLIADQLGVWEADIHAYTHFVDDLGTDSLDVIELMMAFEEEFGITIPDEDMEGLETIDHVIDYLTHALAREAPRVLMR